MIISAIDEGKSFITLAVVDAGGEEEGMQEEQDGEE
jgi:hypothetical protein